MTQSLRKQILYVLVFLFSISATEKASAQRLFFINGHALYAQPGGNFSDVTKGGIGAEVGAGIGWKQTFIVGTTGYSVFFNKESFTNGNTTYIPLKLGLRQYIVRKMLYIHADAGIGKIKNDLVDDSRFSGDVGAGVKLAGWEFQLDYDGFTGASSSSGYNSWIGFKAGFNIGL